MIHINKSEIKFYIDNRRLGILMPNNKIIMDNEIRLNKIIIVISFFFFFLFVSVCQTNAKVRAKQTVHLE